MVQQPANNVKVVVKNTGPKYKILYDLPPGTDIVVVIGGRGSGKTYEISKLTAYSATIKKKRCVILRDEKEKIRESILQEVFNRYDTANANGLLDEHYTKIDSGIRDNDTGDMVVFTQGFRASSKDKKSNLKGVSGVDMAIVEEAEDIRSKEKFNTFRDSIRKEGSVVIVILNTPDVNHWIVNTFFDQIPITDEEEKGIGYFKLEPKKIPGFVAIQTTYKDNSHLPASVVRRYEAYGDPASPEYDLHYYYTSILGYASSGRRGQILTKVKKISLKDYVALPYKEIYGLDFGTSSPAGLIGVKLHRNTAWARQLNYLPKDTLGIGIMLCQMKFTQKMLIIADSAAPVDISKLRSGWNRNELTAEQIERYPQLLKGFWIMPAIKGPGSIESGIALLKGMELFAVEESEDLWAEIRNYIYAVDRNDNPTDEPQDDFNHLIDPWRYVVTARGRYF